MLKAEDKCLIETKGCKQDSDFIARRVSFHAILFLQNNFQLFDLSLIRKMLFGKSIFYSQINFKRRAERKASDYYRICF